MPETLPETPAPQTFALLIGVADYSTLDRSTGRPMGHSDLPGALNDLRSMAMLVRMMEVPAANIRVLSSPLSSPNAFAAVANGRDPAIDMNMAQAQFGPATHDAILESLDWLSAQLQAPNTQGVVYFSGHSVVSTSGHPALAPSDTRRDLDDVRVVPCKDFDSWMPRAVLVSAVEQVTGPSAQRIQRFIDALLGAPFDDLRARALQLAEAQELPDAEAGVERFMRDLGNMGDDGGATGSGRDKKAAQAVKWAGQVSYSLLEIESVLYGDAFTDEDPLRGLISFNRAFFQRLRKLPETNPVQILLETGLQEQPERALAPYYERGEVPLAHGNMAMLAGCQLRQASQMAVFDNRWHGAFTWALVSLLSKTTVKLYAGHRSFDVSYGKLTQDISALLRLMRIEQTPLLSAAKGAKGAKDWEVLGKAPERSKRELPPVIKPKQLNGGNTGHIFQVLDAEGAALGWMIRTPNNSDVVAKGVTWTQKREYWVWNGDVTPWATTTLRLVRPPGTATGGLAGWINMPEGVPHAPAHLSAPAAPFTNSDKTPGGPGWNVSFKEPGPNVGPMLARVQKSGTTLTWFRVGGAPGWLQFGTGPVAPAGREIVWTYTAAPPSDVTYGSSCEDVMV